ncbi:MAG: ABC transporter permease [Oligoflexales bacterium]|nr:ABC transporter permease [Oligoflexales bacterium]
MISSSFYLSLRSMRNRMLSSSLTLLSIALSVALLLGVQRVREGARESFENTISDTDLILGARSGPVQLLLFSVFHIGNATQNISWESYQKWKNHPEVKWAIPISLGDSHKGYRVVGTDENFFSNYKFGRKNQLSYAHGSQFSDLFHVVLGAEVADELSYRLGDKLVLSHGISDVSFQDHEDKPFTVSGILQKTGTPVDRSLFISLEGLSAMHADWESGAPPLPGQELSAEQVRNMDLTPSDVTAMLVGLKSKMGIFKLQRAINDDKEEALLAILPGVTFRELWATLGVAEAALLVVAFFVVIAGVLGMASSILTTLNERRREIAIIRSLGAKPADIFMLLLSESVFLGFGGCLLGIILIYTALWFSQPFVETYFGLFIPIKALGLLDLYLILSVFLLSVFTGIFPALKAYRQSLVDGLTIKL